MQALGPQILSGVREVRQGADLRTGSGPKGRDSFPAEETHLHKHTRGGVDPRPKVAETGQSYN